MTHKPQHLRSVQAVESQAEHVGSRVGRSTNKDPEASMDRDELLYCLDERGGLACARRAKNDVGIGLMGSVDYTGDDLPLLRVLYDRAIERGPR